MKDPSRCEPGTHAGLAWQSTFLPVSVVLVVLSCVLILSTLPRLLTATSSECHDSQGHLVNDTTPRTLQGNLSEIFMFDGQDISLLSAFIIGAQKAWKRESV